MSEVGDGEAHELEVLRTLRPAAIPIECALRLKVHDGSSVRTVRQMIPRLTR